MKRRKKESAKDERITIRLNATLKERIRIVSQIIRQNPSRFVNDAIEDRLKKYEQQLLEQRIRELGNEND